MTSLGDASIPEQIVAYFDARPEIGAIRREAAEFVRNQKLIQSSRWGTP